MPTEAQEIRLGIVTFVRQSLGIGAYTIAAATGARYPRLLGLRSAAERALGRNQLDDAASFAAELLSLAEQFSADWYYGNAVHHGHLVLGEVALARGDQSGAVTELLAAGRTRGSPQLNSFGPNMRLAKALLEAGERASVLEFLQSCESFWALGHRQLQDWAELVRTGGNPDFGANLGY
jgi:hypothetical protein